MKWRQKASKRGSAMFVCVCVAYGLQRQQHKGKNAIKNEQFICLVRLCLQYLKRRVFFISFLFYSIGLYINIFSVRLSIHLPIPTNLTNAQAHKQNNINENNESEDTVMSLLSNFEYFYTFVVFSTLRFLFHSFSMLRMRTMIKRWWGDGTKIHIGRFTGFTLEISEF